MIYRIIYKENGARKVYDMEIKGGRTKAGLRIGKEGSDKAIEFMHKAGVDVLWTGARGNNEGKK